MIGDPTLIGVVAIVALLAIAVLALLSRPRLPDVAEAPMISTPPSGLSPAIAGMIDSAGYPKPALTAAVIDLERQGYLSIGQPEKDGPFVLSRRRTDTPPHPDEAALMRELFVHQETVTVAATDPANRKLLASARKAHEVAVRREFGRVYYRSFGASMFGLLVLTVAACGFVLWSTPAPAYWIGAGLFIVIVAGITQACRGNGTPPRRRGAIAAILLLLMFVGVPVALVIQFVEPPEPYLLVAALAAAFGLVGAFLPRMTPEGLKAREQVNGLRSYMQVSKPLPEEVSAGREAADSRYRGLRPYALATDVGPAWNARHAALLGVLGGAAWTATHAQGTGDGSTGGWTSDNSSLASEPPLDRLTDDMDSAFDAAFDSAFADAFESAVSDSVDSGSSDSGGEGGGADSGGGDSGGGDGGGSSE